MCFTALDKCKDLPVELTYDGGGFDGLHHLLQRLQVRMVVCKLHLLVVQMASALDVRKTCAFKTPRAPAGWLTYRNTWAHLLPLQWDLLSPPSRSSWLLPLYLFPLWPWPLWAGGQCPKQPGNNKKKVGQLSICIVVSYFSLFYSTCLISRDYRRNKTLNPLTSPAPWKTKVWSNSLFLVILRAAKTPATATEAVPVGGRKSSFSERRFQLAIRHSGATCDFSEQITCTNVTSFPKQY